MLQSALNLLPDIFSAAPSDGSDCRDVSKKLIIREPRDIKYWKEKFNKSAHELIVIVNNQSESAEVHVSAIKKCLRTVESVSLIAHEHDYEDIQANGYRSFVKLSAKLFEAALGSELSEQFEFVDVVEKISLFYDHLESYHNEDQQNNYNNKQQRRLNVQLAAMLADGKVYRVIHSPTFHMIQMSSSHRFMLRSFLRFGIVLLPQTTIMEKIRAIVREKSAAGIMAKQVEAVEAHDVKYLVSWCNLAASVARVGVEAFRAVSGWDSNTRVMNVVTNIKSQYALEATVDGLKIEKCGEGSGKMSKVRYQVARTNPGDQETKFDKKIVIYVHGGAFLGPDAHAFEIIVARKIARNIPGLTVVNFDYTLCPEGKYPIPIQELLDFYLWLINPATKMEVINTFGFVPEEVGFLGESSGGQQTTSLYVLLNELKELHDSALKLPKHLLLMFPKISMSFQTYPSTMATLFDPFIFPQILHICYHTYVPMKQFDAASGKFRLIPNEEQVKLPSMDILKDENEMIKDVFLNPLEYKKFEGLKNTSLHIFTSDFDPFLDEAILLAKRWKGSVDLRVFEGIGHSGNVFALLDGHARKANDGIIDMIRSAFVN